MWLMWLISNSSLWMWSVAAAWLMVELRVAPILVALVQAATSLPMLLLGLPFGAIADMVDKRRLLLFSHLWLCAIALIQVGLLLTIGATSLSLLAATFAYGCGVAMRNPTYHAVIPDLVPPEHLHSAMALNAIGMNAARILGPLVTGLIIAVAGSQVVFFIVGILSATSFLLVRLWKPAPRSRDHSPTSFIDSMRGGVSYALRSRRFQSNLLRLIIFFGSVIALTALLPLVALDLQGSNASTFTFLFSAMGAGAVVSMTFLHRLRARFSRDQLELFGVSLHALAMILLVISRSQLLAFAAMLLAGVAFITTGNSLTIASQNILPDWVRARGMAIHQIALMGSMALGSALWGQVATLTNVHTSLAIAAFCSVFGLAAFIHAKPHQASE